MENLTEKQIEAMKKDQKFLKLLHLLIETKGNPSTKEFLQTGYTMGHFILIANRSSMGLYHQAEKILAIIE